MALSTGLIAYYKLENVNDSVGGLTLTNNNTVTFVTGKVNNGANFVAASSQYLQNATDSAFTMGTSTNFTVACWVKFTTSSYNPFVVYGKPLGAAVGYAIASGSGGLRAEIGFAFSTLKNTTELHLFNDGNWHFVVGTFDRAGLVSCYVDNVLESTVDISGNAGQDTTNTYDFSGLMLGRNHNTTSTYSNGMVDEVGIWNRVLTGGEITELWNGGAGTTYPFSSSVTVNLTGVAADPQIGAGTVEIGSATVTPPTEELVPVWFGLPEDEKVYLTGVAASPKVGEITPRAKVTPEELAKLYPFPRPVEERPLTRLVARKKTPEPPKPDAFVYVTGVHPVPKVGSGKVEVYYEDVDEELIGILELIA